MDGQVELGLEPLSRRFDADDDRWLDQVDGLIGELRSAVDDVRVQRTPERGAKGALEAIVLPVVSAGGLTAAVEVVRSWLSRDRTRSLKVSWSDSGKVESIELSGTALDSTRFDDLLQVVTDSLAAGS